MTYLVCEKCGKHYKLKESESIDKSDPCECGGKFRYVQSFGAHFDEELDPINEFNICPDCGNILDETKFCEKCDLKPEKSKKPKRDQNIKK